MTKLAQCPTCGYTKRDAQIHGDHNLCKNAGNAPWEKIRERIVRKVRSDDLIAAATALVEAMENCHVCKGQVVVEEGPIHCEDCSFDCEEHDEPACKPIYVLHAALKLALKKISV